MLAAAYLAGPEAINAAIGWTLYAVTGILSLSVLVGFWMMSGGSKAVLKYLHAAALPPEPDNPAEHRLIHIAEEMSIASGMPVPAVYVLRGQNGINAFAVGDSLKDSAVALTEGCLRFLRRDELQGVVAHEFSHIFNGDVRLNIMVSALVFGLSAFWNAGVDLLSAAEQTEEPDAWEELAGRRRKNPVNPFNALGGLVLMCIGWPGMICGRLLQSTLSQEREYLADASAAQFTRNPQALAGALKKIGAAGSRIRGAHVGAFDHFLFAAGTERRPLYRWMSSHPPLEERILLLDSSFDGTYPELAVPEEADYVDPEQGRALKQIAESLKAEQPAAAGLAAFAVQPEQIIAQIGSPDVNHLVYASAMMKVFPQPLLERMRSPVGAAAAICALVLAVPSKNNDHKAMRFRELLGGLAELVDVTMKVLPPVADMTPQMRLPLLDIAIQRFKKLDAGKRNTVSSALCQLVDTFHPDSLFACLVKHLIAGTTPQPPRGSMPSKELVKDGRKVLFLLAQAGGRPGMLDALNAALVILGSGAAAADDEGMISLAVLGETLKRLEAAPVMFRSRLVKAAARCVIYDGYITVEEAEMLRLLSHVLGCPLPPFLPGQKASL